MNKETVITAIVTVIVAVFDLLKVFGTDIAIDNGHRQRNDLRSRFSDCGCGHLLA